ncbi:hypothetical protein J7T55_003611 [Diaporthe amygdali]|uniref:uncharacterized protein n=1 Tax=Phomopsis amygdali TaxID=1214568 RepID=UPI0022FE1789|nr:uncharacterized protein J7T55_003611 [Diaporthe amygdali]KAJ0117194.1 hypothetical protein J7T55_003611 [Diaporthe amygdali]
MSLGQLTSSVFLYCEPTVPPVTGFITETATVTATVTSTFTEIWEFTAWAAGPTGEWPATYTIEEICTGDPDTWTRPAIPPNFIKTVVTCGVCDRKTQTITCPVEKAAQTGDVTIQGNGVTATPASVPAQATGTSDSGVAQGPGTAPGMAPGSNAMPGMDSGSGATAPAPGAAPGSGPGMKPGAGGDSPAAAPVPAPNNNAGPGSSPASGPGSSPNNGNAGSGSSPASGSGSSPAPNSGSGSAPGAAPPADGAAGGASPTVMTPQSNAGTGAASSPYVTAGAPSLKSALLFVSGIFVLVSGSIICY